MAFQGRLLPDEGAGSNASSVDAGPARLPVSGIVTTFNEQRHIAACLESLEWCDEILVVDSYSDDRTVELIKEVPRVRLHQRKYYGAASQKNWAIDRAEHDWIFILDADERCTPELRAEIEALLTAEPEHAVYSIHRRVFFLGRVIRYSGWQRDRVVRFFRRGFARYPNRRVHADMETRGAPVLLQQPMEHHMAHDFRSYAERVFKYSYWGAADAWKKGRRTNPFEICFRSAWRFFRTYFLQLGFLDGGRGLVFCTLQAYGTYAKLAILWSWRLPDAEGAPDLPEFDEDESTFRPLRRFQASLGAAAPVVFLTHVGKDYTIQKFLESWGQGLEAGVLPRIYPGVRPTGLSAWKRLAERLRSRRTPRFDVDSLAGAPAGVFIFSDLERLRPDERALASSLLDRVRRNPNARILNHPDRLLDRFELLRDLCRRGVNDFDVYRGDQPERPCRWPVFVRHRTRHGGLLSALLHSPEECEAALQALAARGNRMEDLLIVEFSDTADAEGVVRKYGAFRVGDSIVARQIHFSQEWFLRYPDIRTFESSEEELNYVVENPHAAELMKIFDIAGVEYGRIDYAVRADGGISVWEVNTNPMILIPEDRQDLLRYRAHEHFARRFIGALESL